MSGEHIFSEWMGHLLGPNRPKKFTFRQYDRAGTTLKTWKQGDLDWTAKVVCEPCNNGWMSDIEEKHAKPTLTGIIEGRPVSLLTRGIASIAIFGFKVAVIADHMNSKAPAVLQAVCARRVSRYASNPCRSSDVAVGVSRRQVRERRDALYPLFRSASRTL
jgi:hypothetical protein